eukprot:1343490-Rhodomonas_salina.1
MKTTSVRVVAAAAMLSAARDTSGPVTAALCVMECRTSDCIATRLRAYPDVYARSAKTSCSSSCASFELGCPAKSRSVIPS